jgi:hypothetical protein
MSAKTAAASCRAMIAVEVSEFHGMCKQGKVTRDCISQEAQAAGSRARGRALSQDEFDKYDSELVSCIE